MANDKYKDSFWLSYSDLMTSLFFIMLVLFIICIAKMGKALNDANATNEQLNQILQLDKQFEELSKSSVLQYVEDKKMFIAKDLVGIEIFEPEESIIKKEYLSIVDKVGKDLEILLENLNNNNPDFSYLLVIEGYSANNERKSMSKDRSYNYRLSYERALALYNRWRVQGKIDLRKYNTEIQICGSGLNGINRDVETEDNNKRFVIQILPKISRFEEIVYKVQITTKSVKIDNPNIFYHDLEDVDYYEHDGVYKYTAGRFYTRKEAELYCNIVKSKGYNDAFVISIKNGKRIMNTSDKKVQQINGHEYVDLGLPSGLKWATCNVGANSPQEFGEYYNWPCPPWDENGYDRFWMDVSGDEKYDIARQEWCGTWRMPQLEEMGELEMFCTWEKTIEKGVKGYKVIGANGNYIFLPAAGCKNPHPESGFESYEFLYWSSEGDRNYSGGYEESNYHPNWTWIYDGLSMDNCVKCVIRPVSE